MAQDNAERLPIGRTALGGSAAGFTYDGALQDAVAREGQLRRPLRLAQWQSKQPASSGLHEAAQKSAEPARSDFPV